MTGPVAALDPPRRAARSVAHCPGTKCQPEEFEDIRSNSFGFVSFLGQKPLCDLFHEIGSFGHSRSERRPVSGATILIGEYLRTDPHIGDDFPHSFPPVARNLAPDQIKRLDPGCSLIDCCDPRVAQVLCRAGFLRYTPSRRESGRQAMSSAATILSTTP